MKLKTEIIEDLIRVHDNRAGTKDKRTTEYWRQVATETGAALRELLELRRQSSIRIEGSVS